MDIRKQYKDRFLEIYGIKLGFMSFFVKACCAALTKYPVANAFLENSEIVFNGQQNIGIAVSTEKGLIVPVIKNAGTLSFDRIEKQIAVFGEQARTKKLNPGDLTGGTFTITNGGVFGSLLSTPIPTPPQSAILGMHSIQERPIAENGEVVIRPMMYVALTYDHRIMDGREAVGFLVTVKSLLEGPDKLLLGIT
jgi:2-oxoglutarate dehydrogenase E2 component (dihydrolipoamide succinyltransferase)